MDASFYVVDEAALPKFDTDVEPAAVIDAIERVGGFWGEVKTTAKDIEATFRVLDDLVGARALEKIVFAGSPSYALINKIGSWFLGWFDAALVQSLQPVIDARADDIVDQILAAGPTAPMVFDYFSDALEEAKLRGFAVAVVYDI